MALFKGCLPISPYRGLGFVNFIQSATFACAELQSRYLTRVFLGLIDTPPLEEQRREMEDTRNTLAARFIDRSQLRVQVWSATASPPPHPTPRHPRAPPAVSCSVCVYSPLPLGT